MKMVYEIRKQVREMKYILPWNFQSAALSYHTGNASRITAVKRCLGARPPIVFIFLFFFFAFCFLPLWTLLKSINRLPEILFRSSEVPELDFGDEVIISNWLNIFFGFCSLCNAVTSRACWWCAKYRLTPISYSNWTLLIQFYFRVFCLPNFPTFNFQRTWGSLFTLQDLPYIEFVSMYLSLSSWIY